MDVNAVLRDFRPAVEDLAPRGVNVSFELTAGPLLVLADEQRLWQALRHLVVNALESMPQGGTITVESHYVEAPAAQARSLPAQPFACIAVTDSGPGMSAETIAHLFEPYFTTKQPSSQRGLGLPATYGIVTEAGGAIEVDSSVGEGTTVRLWWPAAPQEAVPPPAAPPVRAPAENEVSQPTLLLVEDQAAIRSLLSSVLSDRGYRVLEAIDGAEALEVVASCEHPIHMVVTDVVMPQLSGPDMVTQLRSQDPNLAVLYVSGFHQDSVLAAGDEAPTAFLRKPFGIAALVTVVGELIAARAALDD